MNMRTWFGWVAVGVVLPALAEAQTGAITGTVTRADTAAAVASVEVYVVRNGILTSGTSDASGVFTISGLTPGTYRAFTSVSSQFVNEIFADVACVGACFDEVNAGSGTTIAVAAGVSSGGVDFALAVSGGISGIVTDANGGTPIGGAFVIVAAANGQSVASGQTNGLGQYTVTYGMPSGTYYAFTTNGGGYLNEIYPDVVCPTFCDSADAAVVGAPIPVTIGATTAGIGFALARGATIAGRVTNESTALAVEGVRVTVYDAQGEHVTSTTTTGTGDYLTPGLIAGSYFLATSNEEGFVNELYDNVPCVGDCSAVTAGTPLVLATGQAVTGRDFALTVGGRIAGSVTAASGGAPLSGIGVRVYSATGIAAAEASTDGNGNFLTTTGLPTGTYYLAAVPFNDYLSEIYDDVPCHDCGGLATVTQGTAVAVTAGVTTSGRNFQLTRGGTISGRVVSTAGAAAVTGIEVRAAGPDGAFGSDRTDASGQYAIGGLPAGEYVVWTIYGAGAGAGFVDEIYPDRPCVGFCDDTLVRFLGQPLPLASEGSLPNIDFALAPAGSASGTVTDAGTGAPVANVSVHVATLQGGAYVGGGSAVTNGSGAFVVPGLSPGTYVAYTENTQGYIDEMLGGLPCLGQCGGLALLGTPFTVTGSAATGGLGFALDRGGRIAGTVSDASGGGPVRNAYVTVHDRSGAAVAFAQSAVDGTYVTGAGLLPGTYYLAVRPAPPYREQAFGAACVGPCDGAQTVAVGSPVTVSGATTTGGIDVPLIRGGLVAGTLTEQGTGIVLAFKDVHVVDGQGRRASSAFSGSTGDYVLDHAVPAGTYFAFTDTDGHVDEIFDNVACLGECAASRAPGGTAIQVASDATTGGRHFALARRSGVPGPPLRPVFSPTPGGLVIQWTAPTTGGVPQGYAVDVGLSPGTTAISLPAATTALVVGGPPPGRFYVRVRGINASGAGPASAEAVLGLGGGAMLPDVPRFAQAWMVGARLFMRWERNQFGGEATHYLVEAGTATGLSNIATIPVSVPAFTFAGVPPGTYFLRVRAVSAAGVSGPSNEVMVVAGGAASPPGAPYAVGAVVTGSNGAITWSTPAGPVTGYVLEAGTAAGLSNAAVVPLGPQTSVAFAGIPPGRYFVRVRAVNGLGVGPVSEEVTVVVH
jgi:hypothetical protein